MQDQQLIDDSIVKQNLEFAKAVDDALINGKSYIEVTFTAPQTINFKHIESKHITNTEASGLILTTEVNHV